MSCLVILVLLLAVVAAVYGLVRGGSLEGLARTQFRFVWVLLAGLLIQVTFDIWDPEWLSETGDIMILLGTNVAVATFLALNRQLPGMWLAAAGLLLNVLVIGANGAMPVSMEAADFAGLSDQPSWGMKHEALNDATLLPWIADVIPVPGLKMILSVGDVVLAAGIGWLVYKRTLEEEEPTQDRDAVRPRATSG